MTISSEAEGGELVVTSSLELADEAVSWKSMMFRREMEV